MVNPDKQPSDAPQNLSRRGFIRDVGLAAAAIALPCTTVFANGPFTPNNFFDAMRPRKFMDQNGRIVDMSALQRSMNDSPFTVHFSFSSCGRYCPISNVAMRELSEAHNPPIKHIVINASPVSDGMDQTGRDGFHKSLQYENYTAHLVTGRPLIANGVKSENITVLFPLDNNGELSQQSVIETSIALKNVTDKNDAQNHSSNIHFYKPNGDFVVKATTTQQGIQNNLLPQIAEYYAALARGRTR